MHLLNSLFQEFFLSIRELGLRDLIDVTVMAIFYYYVLLAIRSTRALQIVQGIVALLVLTGIAFFFQLQMLSYVLNGILVTTVVALPVVFQPELRRALMRLGQQGILQNRSMSQLDKAVLDRLVDEVAFACFNLSLANYGALIVLEQHSGLQEVVETGQVVHGTISAKLLQTIFHPKTPLHDGAVVIRGEYLEAAACYLPLTDSVVDARFGTRHRAAIGISEQSDAIVVVVSEETGEMRIAREGRFTTPMTEEHQLRAALNRMLISGAKTAASVEQQGGLLDRLWKNLFGASTAENNDTAEEDNVFDDSVKVKG